MNKSYLNIIITILFLGISNQSFAQAVISGSGEFQAKKGTVVTQGFPIFYTEDNYPHITFSSNTNSELKAHNLVIQAEINRYNAWLNRQKDVFKEEIQEQLGQNFSDFEKAQKEFYKDKELKNVKKSAGPLKVKYKNKTNLKKELRSVCIRNIKLLNLRANEISAGNVNNSRYGHLKYGSTPISEIRSASQVNNLRAQEIGEFNNNQWRLDQESKIHDFIKSLSVLNNRNHDILKNISRYQLDYYNRSGNDWDKLDLMQAYIHDTYYLASPYAPSSGVLNYGQESYVEWYGIEKFPAKLSVFHPDYWETIVSHPTGPVVAQLNAERLRQEALNNALNEISNPEFLTDVAIAGLGVRNENFIKDDPDLNNEVNDYFKKNDFSKASSDCMNYLLNQFQDGGDFTLNTNLYESASTPLYQNAQNNNRALNWKPGVQAVTEGFTNFGNVLAELLNNNANPSFEGYIIRDMFGVNGLNVSAFIQNEWLGNAFYFITNNGTSVEIQYENNNGTILYNNGVSTNAYLNNLVQNLDNSLSLAPQIERLLFINPEIAIEYKDFLSENNGSENAKLLLSALSDVINNDCYATGVNLTALGLRVNAYYQNEKAHLQDLHPDWSDAKISKTIWLDIFQTGLDVIGLIPGVGEIADLTNGVIYYVRGDNLNAGLSFAATIPFLGWGATGSKVAIKVFEAAGAKAALPFIFKAGKIFYGSRRKLRSKVLNLAIGDTRRAHHVIPWRFNQNKIIQAASQFQTPWHPNSLLNGIPVQHFRHRGSHNRYDAWVRNNLSQWELQGVHNNPQEAYQKLAQLANYLKQLIDANPGVKINDLPF